MLLYLSGAKFCPGGGGNFQFLPNFGQFSQVHLKDEVISREAALTLPGFRPYIHRTTSVGSIIKQNTSTLN